MKNILKVKIRKISPNAVVPTYGSAEAAGADLYACLETAVTVWDGKTTLIGTGLSMEIPEGYAGFVYARSGLATKKGLAPANKVGVIDSDYRGEVTVALHNHTGTPIVIRPGDRIAQIVFAPVYQAEFSEEPLSETERGEGGFGSTGK